MYEIHERRLFTDSIQFACYIVVLQAAHIWVHIQGSPKKEATTKLSKIVLNHIKVY